MRKSTQATIQEKCQEIQLITAIAKRAATILNMPQHSITFTMDLELCHSQNPLRLQEMLFATPSALIHDVCGINKNLNHDTGKLDNCFSPRYSVI
jgi:hypothetical protein